MCSVTAFSTSSLDWEERGAWSWRRVPTVYRVEDSSQVTLSQISGQAFLPPSTARAWW